jgi:uncharacterized protein (PEP-CTERM system associated)
MASRPGRRRSLRAGVLVAAALALAAPPFATPANAQLLPQTGTTMQVGGLHQQLEGLLAGGAGTPAVPGWTITPALGVEQRWTDHLQELGGSGPSSFITVLTPSVLINGQTVRTDTTVSYAPELQYYSSDNQERISQNLNASSKITLVPERLFLDLRGFAAMQPINGGYAQTSTSAVDNHSETQDLSFSAHPYLQQRFGDLGFAELGATLSRTSQSGLSASQSSGLPAATAAITRAQSLTSEQEYFSLTSGPAFGRTTAGLSLSESRETGSGGTSNSHRDQATVDLGYAITRSITALASFGHDDTHYSGTPPYKHSGMDWSGGARWVPNPDSSITATYGSLEGVNSVQVDATYAPTARTRVFARYSEGIATGLEQLVNAMNGSTLDPMGNPVDSSGAPVQLINSFYGVQNNPARVTSTSVTAVLMRDRDSFSASINRQQRHQIASTSVTTASTQDTQGLYGSLTWQRDLRPNLQSSTFVQWGTNQNTTVGNRQNSDSLVFSLRLAYVVSQTLNAYAQYSWTRQTNTDLAGTNQTQPSNLVIIGAHKTF